jgi:plasmid stabilization system protein ParE
MLAESPGVGHVREDITQNESVLFWSVRPSLIAYRRAADVVEILFVERGERDWDRLLEKDF